VEEIDLVDAGSNLGWPICDGGCGLPQYRDPLFSYPHTVIGGAVVGGAVYRGTEFPSEFQGSYFYGDFTNGWIRRLTLSAGGVVTGDFPFESTAGNLIFLRDAPDGALYYITYENSSVHATAHLGAVRRIVYTAGASPPQIIDHSANPAAGPGPLTVQFDATASDADGDALSFHWIFGDGASAVGPAPVHTYTVPGIYNAHVIVTDGLLTAVSESIPIQVGAPPSVAIVAPVDGSTFRAGDRIVFGGYGWDSDGPMSGSDVTWSVIFWHDEHTHPGPVFAGTASDAFEIPTSGHEFHDETYYEIVMTATDADGLEASASVQIFPEKVDLVIDTVPSGLDVLIDSQPHPTPLVYDTLIGFRHEFGARSSLCAGSSGYQFGSWSNGGSLIQPIIVPEVGTSYVATYLPTSECGNRIEAGLLALYDFGAGTGSTVFDVSGVGAPLDLTIADPAAVSWLETGLSIDSPTTIASVGPASKLLALQATGELTLEVWARSDDVTQFGPARIAFFSVNGFPAGGNFGLGQSTSRWSARLRTTTTSVYGTPSLDSPTGAVDTGLHQIVFTRSVSGVTSMYIDSVLAAQGFAGGTLGNWDASAKFVLGNEPTGDRPWLGDLRLVAVYDRALDPTEVEQNYLDGTGLLIGPPVLQIDAEDQQVFAGDAATFRVVLEDVVGLEYQWQQGGVDIVGAQSATYTTPATLATDDGQQFRCIISNALGTVVSRTALLNVDPDRAPIAVDDVFAVGGVGDTLSIDASEGLLSNDDDPDGDPLTLSIVSGPTRGTLDLSPDGSFTYERTVADFQPEVIVYEISDGDRSDSAVLVISVDIPFVGIPPTIIVHPTDQNVEEGATASFSVAANGTPLLVHQWQTWQGSWVDVPGATTAVLTLSAVVLADDASRFRCIVSNDYGEETSGEATLTVTVPVNDAPVAQPDVYDVPLSGSLVVSAAFGVLSNDFDPDGDLLTAELITATAHGTIDLAPDGGFVYEADASGAPFDTFEYRAHDGELSSAITLVTLTRATPIQARARWRFDDAAGTVAVDASGFGHDGTLVGGATWTAGISGGAVQLDGIDDRVRAPSPPFEMQAWTGLTVGAWVRNDVGSGAGSDDIVTWWRWNKYPCTDCSFLLAHHSNDQYFFQIWGKGEVTGGSVDSAWHHVVATYDGTAMRLYVDAVAVATLGGLSGPLPFSSADLLIGGQGNGTNYFDGAIDDARIYDVALTSGEIAAWMSESFDASPPSAPSGLTIGSVTESSIQISWSPASDPESGIASYEISRDGSAVGSSTGVGYVDTGLEPGSTHDYQVRAINGAGLVSFPSETIQATTTSDTVAPVLLGVSASLTSLVVSFDEPLDPILAEDPSRYTVDGGVAVLAATLGMDEVTVVLATTPHTAGVPYTLTVDGIADLAGNLLS
ncbi:MAG: cadherin-like domain-containing protein, partial [Planctomycetes bacterium]|nr:cadherin-like domain-containing protein [Planctomycetota bacterium]